MLALAGQQRTGTWQTRPRKKRAPQLFLLPSHLQVGLVGPSHGVAVVLLLEAARNGGEATAHAHAAESPHLYYELVVCWLVSSCFLKFPLRFLALLISNQQLDSPVFYVCLGYQEPKGGREHFVNNSRLVCTSTTAGARTNANKLRSEKNKVNTTAQFNSRQSSHRSQLTAAPPSSNSDNQRRAAGRSTKLSTIAKETK